MTKPQTKLVPTEVARPARRRRFIVLLLTAFLVVAAAAGYYFGSRYVEAKDHWRQAEAALAKQDFAAAKEHLDHCLAFWPESAEVHFVMARTCRRWGDFAAAKKHLKEAEQRRWPRADIDLEYLLGSVQQSGPTKLDAETLAHRLAVQPSDEPLILEAIVTGLFSTHRIPETKRWLDYWVEHHPDDWVAYYWRGHLNYLTGSPRPAHADLERAIQLRPDHEDLRKMLIAVQMVTGNYRPALDQLEIRLRSHPGDVEALAKRARCQRNLGELVAAQDSLDQLFAKHPDTASGALTKALLEADRDRVEAALQWLRRFEQSPPTDIRDLVAAAQLAVGLHRRLGQEHEAQQRQERLEALLGDHEAVKQAMGEIGGGASDPDLYLKAGSIYLRLGLGKEAEPLLQSVVAMRPDDRAGHRLLAELYQQRGDAASRRLAEQHTRLAGTSEPKQER